MPKITTEIITSTAKLDELRSAWDALNASFSPGAVSCDEYRSIFERENNDADPLLVLLREDETLIALAPFLLLKKEKVFAIGPRHLFRLPIRELRLQEYAIVGKEGRDSFHHVFRALAENGGFDLLSFNELEENGSLHTALREAAQTARWRCTRSVHKSTVHWSIEFPASFDEYLASLSSKARKNRLREIRTFEKEHGGLMRIISREDEIDAFLEAAEGISRLTYQWNAGQQLRADDATRTEFRRIARQGILRCYLLYAGEQPCAFARGTFRGAVYRYDTPGYDPAYSKFSPGSILLMKIIEDLIANTGCRSLDFGIGGGETGYKKIFGNHSYPAISIQLGPKSARYTTVLFLFQGTLNLAKRCGESFLEKTRLKDLVKRALRKYGDH